MRTAREVPTPLAVQEQHDLADHLLLGPARDDLRGRLGPMPVHLAQPRGLLLDQLEHGFPERPHQLPGVDRPDAADHAGAEIALDALERGGRARLQEAGAELQTMRAVIDPAAAELDELAGRDRGRVPDHGDQVPLPARLYPQHAEAIVRIVERDPLDQPGQHLGRLRGRTRHIPLPCPSRPQPGPRAIRRPGRALGLCSDGVGLLREPPQTAGARFASDDYGTRG